MSTPNDSVFKLRLQQTRKLRELSQDELANKAELPSTTISHFESGKRKPSFDNLRKLADALEVSIDYLMGRTNKLSGNQSTEAEIFRDYENLTDDDRELARDFMARLAKRKKDK
ncbi:Transcriptional regulator, Xre family [hydrothermal vent metagenome]|uniref:Transcriptional regulator, Xre family n=1 Tax=hydrothermal vent metagenome TaxID=652676 RepID=A0A3B0VR46_9ZZZZ